MQLNRRLACGHFEYILCVLRSDCGLLSIVEQISGVREIRIWNSQVLVIIISFCTSCMFFGDFETNVRTRAEPK